jgi:hypothetical protein
MIRDAFDPRIEEILDIVTPKIDYSILFDDEPYADMLNEEYNRRVSFREFLPTGRMPVVPADGFERVMYEYELSKRKRIFRMDEDTCLVFLKQFFPDIYKIQHVNYPNDTYPTDFRIPKFNIEIDHKEREGALWEGWEIGYGITQKKWNNMFRVCDEPYYLNSTPIGLFIWNLKLIGEPEWVMRRGPKTTRIKNGSTEWDDRYVGYLPFEKSNDLTYLLLR